MTIINIIEDQQSIFVRWLPPKWLRSEYIFLSIGHWSFAMKWFYVNTKYNKSWKCRPLLACADFICIKPGFRKRGSFLFNINYLQVVFWRHRVSLCPLWFAETRVHQDVRHDHDRHVIPLLKTDWRNANMKSIFIKIGLYSPFWPFCGFV